MDLNTCIGVIVRESYHHVLNVLFHQILLSGHKHRPAKCIQVGVVQLVSASLNGVWSLQVNISDERTNFLKTLLKNVSFVMFIIV